MNFQVECDRQATQVVDQFLKKRQFIEKVLTSKQRKSWLFHLSLYFSLLTFVA